MHNLNNCLCDKVKKNCLKNKNEESCGMIIADEVIACENLSPFPSNHFIINPMIVFEKKPDYIYHSHVRSSCKPSRLDLIQFKEINIPFLIYSLIDDEFYLLK
jgi:proteasome lid subunit RPN8/RPN11